MTRKSKNLIIVGNKMPDDWEFKSGIEDATGEPWKIKECITNKFNGINKYTRYFKYFFVPFQVFLQRNNYKRIISWDQFYCLILAFYTTLFPKKVFPKIYVMAFIYLPKKGFIGKIYRAFVARSLKSKYLSRIFVYGKSETAYYSKEFGIPEDMFSAKKLGLEDLRDRYGISRGDYFVSAGRSNRDYGFLRKNWDPSYGKLLIICDTDKGSSDPDSIEVLKDCHGKEYLELLAGCYGVIIPLKDKEVSSGQMVAIQSAMFGKPVICTDNKTMREYVGNGKSGIIVDKDPGRFRKAMESILDIETYEKMAKEARMKFEKEFSLYGLGYGTGIEIIGKKERK